MRLRRQSDNALVRGRIHINRLKPATERFDVKHASHELGDEQDKTLRDTVTRVQVDNDNSAQDTGTGGAQTQHSTQTDKFYEIEKIVGKKYLSAEDQWEYRVKWRNFPTKQNSWVKFEDLNSSCQQYVQAAADTIPTVQCKQNSKHTCKPAQ